MTYLKYHSLRIFMDIVLLLINSKNGKNIILITLNIDAIKKASQRSKLMLFSKLNFQVNHTNKNCYRYFSIWITAI